MEKVLHILPTYSTPEVLIDLNKSTAFISGKSVPEDSMSFYKPVIAFLDTLKEGYKDQEFNLKVDLEYFNSNSSKFLLDIFLKLARFQNEGFISKVLIDWVADQNDDDMIEAGEDYMAIVKLPFNIINR